METVKKLNDKLKNSSIPEDLKKSIKQKRDILKNNKTVNK